MDDIEPLGHGCPDLGIGEGGNVIGAGDGIGLGIEDDVPGLHGARDVGEDGDGGALVGEEGLLPLGLEQGEGDGGCDDEPEQLEQADGAPVAGAMPREEGEDGEEYEKADPDADGEGGGGEN